MNKFLTLLFAVLFSLSTFAIPQMAEEEMMLRGKESHGGDDIAIQFITSARAGIDKLERYPLTDLPVSIQKLRLSLSNIKVMTTDRALEIKREGNKQNSTAINYISDSGEMVVLINRTRWSKISDGDKHALALHEVLCLHGVEKTYDYTYSSAISADLLELQKTYNGFDCSSEYDSYLSLDKIEELVGRFVAPDGVQIIRFFPDFQYRKLKYIYELDSFIGHFISTETVEFCKKKGSDDNYITFSSSIFKIEINEDSLSMQRVLKDKLSAAKTFAREKL